MVGLSLAAIALTVSSAAALTLQPRQNASAWQDKSLSPRERANILISQLSFDEKVSQMGGIRRLLDVNATFNRTVWESTYPLQHGHLSFGYQLNSAQDVLPIANMVRQEQLNKSNIPWITMTDSVNSIYVTGGTIFPSTLTLSTSWNLPLYSQVVAAIRDENMALGTHWVLSPELDIAKDPRNGRVGEMYGEDVHLIGEFAAQYVKTMQELDENGYIKVACTIKHFFYGQSAGGINTASMEGGVNYLYNDLAIPYIRAIKENPVSIMISYSSVDRVPMSLNTKLIQGMLRKEMGFQGMIMSDALGIAHLYTQSLVASSIQDAAVKSLKAGLQIELAPGLPAFPALAALSNDSEVQALVTEAARHMLEVKFATGMFDLPLPTLENLNKVLRAPAHLEVNRQASRESIVLLKNDGLLPRAHPGKVAVLGPFGNILDPGSYAPVNSANPRNGKTLLVALQEELGAGNVQFVAGVGINNRSDGSGIKNAVAAAKSAGLAIVAVGSLSVYFNDPNVGDRTDGEFFSHPDLGFPGEQQQLLDAVLDTGVPTILVLNGGQAFVLNNSTLRSNAILHSFLGGEFTNEAVVEVITGKVNPSGKLTITLPQAQGAFPIFYDYLPSDHQGGFAVAGACTQSDWTLPCLNRNNPPMAFGFGLSYTTFNISAFKVTHNATAVQVSCSVTNTGKVAGKEVVQVYYRQQYSIIELPVKRLIRFEKVDLQPGESKVVTFSIDRNDMGYYIDAKHQVDAGNYTIWIGSSSRSQDLQNTTITL